MNRDRLLSFITLTLFVSGVLTIGWTLYSGFKIKDSSGPPPNLDCVHKSQRQTMGSSELGSVLEKGQQFRLLTGFYACNPILRGDLVAFSFSSALKPVVRIVRGLPGDKAEVRLLDSGHWEIVVNDQPVQGVEGNFRLSDPATPPPLQAMLQDRNGRLSDDEYILMTLLPPGSADSVHLGPTPATLISGKVMALPKPQQ